MKVTIVDSEPAVAAMIDCLDHLPTQPPSLYLDIEGVRLSRNGSISIIQVFVVPQDQIFLIDVFVLREAAFSTCNLSGINLRAVLESAEVPKVFFDVRNDSDALFAHFHISMQGVHDVQLLEVATRTYSRERVSGLSTCIERYAKLTPEAAAAWKAAKQKGRSRFAPELGGSYEVFNSRPMLQDIVDYCTQDVVYLPLLWKKYTQKISTSTKWMKKVQDETCKRILMSKEASYDPHSRNKTLSPWAKPAKSGQGKRPDNNKAKAPGRESLTADAQKAATEAAKKTAATQPCSKPQSQPSVQQTALWRSARIAALNAAAKTSENNAELQHPLFKLEVPIRSKTETATESHRETKPPPRPVTAHRKWTCTTCGREMQQDQKEVHLAGKQHIARTNQTSAPQTGMAKQKSLQTTTVASKNRQSGTFSTRTTPRQTNLKPPAAAGKASRKTKAAVPQSPQRGLAYPPDALFVGFREMGGPRHHQYAEPSWALHSMDYSICDKDCGWCGHCMDGVNVGF